MHTASLLRASTVALILTAASAQDARGPAAEARSGRPGPWDHDVIIYSVSRDGRIESVGKFGRSGVPTIARLADGRLIAAHQHFPAIRGGDPGAVATKDGGLVVVITGEPREQDRIQQLQR